MRRKSRSTPRAKMSFAIEGPEVWPGQIRRRRMGERARRKDAEAALTPREGLPGQSAQRRLHHARAVGAGI